MKAEADYYSTMGLILLMLTGATHNALAFPGFGGVVDSTCANLGYPLAPEFEPEVSGDCHACHDDGAGGSGAGKTAYDSQNFEYFCVQPPKL